MTLRTKLPLHEVRDGGTGGEGGADRIWTRAGAKCHVCISEPLGDFWVLLNDLVNLDICSITYIWSWLGRVVYIYWLGYVAIYRLTQTLSSCSVKGRLLTLAAMHVSVHLPTSSKFYWLWVLVFDSSVVWLMMVQSFSAFRVESYFGHCACSSWSWFFALKHTSSGLHIVLGFLLAKVYVAHISHSFVFVI